MPADEQPIIQELSALNALITKRLRTITPSDSMVFSRWNGGVLPLEEEQALVAKAVFHMADGVILVARGLYYQDTRWRSLIHELLHAHSAGGTVLEYSAAVGWEEAPVEFLQRRWRRDLLRQAGVFREDMAFADGDGDWDARFGSCLLDLEYLRRELYDGNESDAERFYAEMLSVPIRDRYRHVLNRVTPPTSPERRRGLLALSRVRRRIEQPEGIA